MYHICGTFWSLKRTFEGSYVDNFKTKKVPSFLKQWFSPHFMDDQRKFRNVIMLKGHVNINFWDFPVYYYVLHAWSKGLKECQFQGFFYIFLCIPEVIKGRYECQFLWFSYIFLCIPNEIKEPNKCKFLGFFYIYVTWSRGMSRMSGILILSYRLKEATNSYVSHCFWTSKNCPYLCNQMSDWDAVWIKI